MDGGFPVTVVIPTQNRPALLTRAVRSALSQTLPPLEVVLILDKASRETLTEISHWSFPAVKCFTLSAGGGASDARNCGIQNARGEWIAFLDDDDEWLPRKLELQARAALQSKWAYPIVCSRMILRTKRGDFIQPLRGPGVGERIDEYLFCRKTFAPGETLLQTSNMVAPRTLLQQVCFRSGQYICEDTDWVLRAATFPRAGLEFVPEVLSIYNAEDERRTLSDSQNWRYVFFWVKRNEHLFTSAAYAGALVRVLHLAVQQSDESAILPIMSELLSHKPNGRQLSLSLLLIMATWFMPRKARNHLRLYLRRYFEKLSLSIQSSKLLGP